MNIKQEPVTGKDEMNSKQEPVTDSKDLEMNTKQEPVTDNKDIEMNIKQELVTDKDIEVNIKQEPVTDNEDISISIKQEPATDKEEIQMNSKQEPVTDKEEIQMNIKQGPVTDNEDISMNIKQEPATDKEEIQTNIKQEQVTDTRETNTKAKPRKELITDEANWKPEPATSVSLVMRISQEPTAVCEDVEDQLHVETDLSSLPGVVRPLEGSPPGHSKRSCASGSAGRDTANKPKGTGTFSMDTAVRRKVPPGPRSSHTRALPRTDGCQVRSSTSDSQQREVDSVMRADSSGEAWRSDRGHVPAGCPNRPRAETAARCINEPATNPSPDSRLFACSRCSARWKTRAHLNKHASAVHTDKVFALSLIHI